MGVGLFLDTPCVCHRLLCSEAAGLLECWHGLQKALVKLQVRENHLQEWIAIFQDAVYALNWKLPHSSVSPIERIYGSGNQEVGTEVFLYIVAHSVPLWGLVLSVPASLSSAGLIVLVP